MAESTDGVIISQYQTTRIRHMFSSYKRIFQLTNDEALTLDPSTLTVTNRFEYSGIAKISPDTKNDEIFAFDFGAKNYVFKTSCRSQLLSQLYYCIHHKLPEQLQLYGPFEGKRLRKGGSKSDIKITVAAFGLVEYDGFGKILQEYRFVNISRCGIDEKNEAFIVEVNGRMKFFLVTHCKDLLSGCRDQIAALSLKKTSAIMIVDFILPDEIARRNEINNITRAAVSVFDVSKSTRRSVRPVSRQMHVTEEFIVEKDSSGFQNVSYQRIDCIYAIVRSWSSPRDFTIEYYNGTSRTYSCAIRDTLLATLLDICHAIGNQKVIITGEISDNLRLLPRDTDEECYAASMKDSIFGATSIESFLLSRLILSCKNGSNARSVELASREFNANVPCPGVSPNTDVYQVRQSLTGVLETLHDEVMAALEDERLDNSRLIVTLLQTLYRIIPCIHGYKCFLEVKEVDTRLLILQLLKLDRDFVNYWTLEVLSVLCRCPLSPRNVQQEFVNKHTLLNDRILRGLIDLMSNRIDPTDDISGSVDDGSHTPTNSTDPGLSPHGQTPTGSSKQSNTESNNVDNSRNATSTMHPYVKSPQTNSTAPNPTPTAHLNVDSGTSNSNNQAKNSTNYISKVDTSPVRIQPFSSAASSPVKQSTAQSAGGTSNRMVDTNSTDVSSFPNSLVIISAATLLESVVSSRRDTSSPELLNSFLDLLSARCEVLLHMLRSNSFIILENAAILMFILLKNRGSSAKLLKELALSESLTLKHFYNAVYSPSGTQRYISRFVVNTWLAGSEKSNPGKALLCRMIPSGLIEFLKHAPISDEHESALDEIEIDFYANTAGGVIGQGNTGRRKENLPQSGAMDVQARMRRRISTVLRERMFSADVCSAHARSGLTHEQQVQASARFQLQQQQQQQLSLTSPTSLPQALSPTSQAHTTLPVDRENSSDVLEMEPPANINRADLGSAFFRENYRVMFHMMTKNHQLPDLIWNERTRLELRIALDSEIKSFDKEQRLVGTTKIAWNFQQFEVIYESLKNEMQVGKIYIRHLLEANDSFFRTLDNPTPVVLFEKLFRRVLVNVTKNPVLSVVCTRSLIRLYCVCWDYIGSFDDMLLIVKILDEAENMELQHCLLDLIELLSSEESNLNQLLDKEFLASLIKYASLAHLNPDQIGNVLARLTNNVLMLKESEEKEKEMQGVRGSNPVPARIQSDPKRPRTLWIPDDISCPRVWFIAPNVSSALGSLPPVESQKGPYRVSELMDMLTRGVIQDDCLVAPFLGDDGGDEERFDCVVDTGRWRVLKSYDQLRMQLLSPGRALYSPAEVAAKSLTLLIKLAEVHRSSNILGTPFYPIPTSKRLMSNPEHLATYSQLLLSNNSTVVETAAMLLTSLVEFNAHANNKLYLSGAFYFACRYSGNNFVPLARLFEVSHTKQSYYDSAASLVQDLPLASRSFLINLLPPAVVNILINYGADRFASVFTSDFDTPEVIWGASLRFHLVEMLEQHLGDFASRLKQFTLATYDFCPIPRIHFAELNQEIYVHEYYLRNFCDEVRFPDWPVGEPLIFLREVLQRWRIEMSKGVEDNAVEEAKKVLGFGGKQVTYAELRKSYKNLARKFHPDKNPNGRQTFEKIRVAYDLLSSVDMKVTETDMGNVALLIKTQNIIYRRFPETVNDQKYPAFQHLMDVLTVPSPSLPESSSTEITTKKGENIDQEHEHGNRTTSFPPSFSPSIPSVLEESVADLLIAGATLIFYTCSVSPLNVREFVKVGGTQKLFDITVYAISILDSADAKKRDIKIAHTLLYYSMKSFTAVAAFDVGRIIILSLCPFFAEVMGRILMLDKIIPVTVESCIETISRCCSSDQLQVEFENAGLIWKLIPMLLAYDGTLQEDYTDESLRMIACQNSSNMHAVLAAKALGRLSGVMFDDLSSPPNTPVIRCLNLLLTQPIAKLLRNRRPWDLLSALNQNVEKTTMIWNINMRRELLEFVLRIDRNRSPGSRSGDLIPAERFKFSALEGELCVCGVYLRIFNKTALTVDIDDSSVFAKDLLDYIRNTLSNSSDNENKESKDGSDDRQEEGMSNVTRTNSNDEDNCFHDCNPGDSESEYLQEQNMDPLKSEHYGLQLSVEALRTLADVHNYIAYDIATHTNGPDTIFSLLDLPSGCTAFLGATQLLTTLGRSADFVCLAMGQESARKEKDKQSEAESKLGTVTSMTGDLNVTNTAPLSGTGTDVTQINNTTDKTEAKTEKGIVTRTVGEISKTKSSTSHPTNSSCLWRLLRAVCTTVGPGSPFLWSAADGYSSHTEGLRCLLDTGGVEHMLGVLASAPGYTNSYLNRLNAIMLLSKFLSSPVLGDEASASLRRYLPEPLVLLLRSRAANASLACLDEVCETPELIWTAEMQLELRAAVASILAFPTRRITGGGIGVGVGGRGNAENDNRIKFQSVPSAAKKFTVTYRQLQEEIQVGNVYIRLFLKQPTFRLSNPIFFLEKLIELWDHSFDKQVPVKKSALPVDTPTKEFNPESLSGSQALVVGKEDFLCVITSCVVCVLKSDQHLTSHLMSWGFISSICVSLKRALDLERRGEPVTCAIRILYQLADSQEAVESLASIHVDPIALITRVIKARPQGTPLTPNPPLPQEASFIVELIKKIYGWGKDVRTMDHLVNLALESALPLFLLEGVIRASPRELSCVRSPSSLKVHAVAALKAMLAASTGSSAHSVLYSLLNSHPAWTEFGDQNHDLFITDLEKTDHFLLQDTTEVRFMGLLTNGSNASASSQSTTHPMTSSDSDKGKSRTSFVGRRVSVGGGDVEVEGVAADGLRHSVAEDSLTPPNRKDSNGGNNSIRRESRSVFGTPQQQSYATQNTNTVSPLLKAQSLFPAESQCMPYLPTQPRPIDPSIWSPSRGLSESSNLSSNSLSSMGRGSSELSMSGNGQVSRSNSRHNSSSGKDTVTPERLVKSAPNVSPKGALNSTRVTFRTAVHKGEHGIGLDLGKTVDGRVVIQRFKELPPGVINPAQKALPRIKPGDFIIGINGNRSDTFSDCVNAIRGCSSAVEMEIERIVFG